MGLHFYAIPCRLNGCHAMNRSHYAFGAADLKNEFFDELHDL
jgi:hypothetical protein